MTREGQTLEATTVEGSYDNGHGLRNASAIAGALLGATTGILGGIAGISAAGLLGALLGGLGGLALERRLRHRDNDDNGNKHQGNANADDNAAWAALIEPACGDCADVREASGGTVTTCARHAKKRASGNLHFEYPQSFALGSMLFRPTF